MREPKSTGVGRAIRTPMVATMNLKEQFGFPKQHGQSQSYWLEGVRGDKLLNHRTTPDLPSSADVVIIGSGMAGTLIAKHCAETWPEKRIVVLEAREFCSGATGRNAGHCKPDQFRGFKKYEERFGTEQALAILENEQQTWTDLVKYVHENDVDCDLWVGETLDVPMTVEVAAITKDSFQGLKAAGGRVNHIKVTHDPVEAAKISRLKDAKACYAWPASTLYPWKLTAHIMRENLKMGVNLQTSTMVTRVKPSLKSLGTWVVESDRGNIECTQVVHATNAYGSALEPSLRGVVIPEPHICNKVVPPVAFGDSNSLENSYGVLMPDGAMFSINPRCNTADNVVLFGGSNPGQKKFDRWLREHPKRCTDDGLTAFKPISEAVQKLTESQFEGWTKGSETCYDDAWSGIMGMTPDTLPLVGQLPDLPGQWVCAGFNGHGMARIFTASPGLVKLMDGKPWAGTHLPSGFELTAERLDRLKKVPSKETLLDLTGMFISLEISGS